MSKFLYILTEQKQLKIDTQRPVELESHRVAK